MKRLTIALIGVAVAFLGNVAFCQDAAGIPDEIIKELDGLVGTWNVNGKMGDHDVTGVITFRWPRTEDKRKCCLLGNFSFKTADGPKNGVTLVGWNAAKKCIEDRGFNTDGGNATSLWTVKSPTEWHGDFVLIEGGTEMTAKMVRIKKGPSEVVAEMTLGDGGSARLVYTKLQEEGKRKAKR